MVFFFGELTRDVRDLEALEVAESSSPPPGLVHLVLQAAVHHPELQLDTDDAEFSAISRGNKKRLNVGGSCCDYLLVDGKGDGHSYKGEPAKAKRHRWSLEQLLDAKVNKH